ncbi:hypothetical protein DEA06_14405 [Microbacterium sp. Gd 4-13]|nr:hypothetical protein DEA06_14405 [Microbacterium sp. Gd 4-13]
MRRRVIVVAGATLAAAIVVLAALLGISIASDGEVSVLIWTLGSDRLAGLAVIAAFASLALGLCLTPVSRSLLLLLLPARLVAVTATCIAGSAWFLTSGATVVQLVSAGCETGYVVEEEAFLLAGWGTVYRTDGVLVTAVERTGGDDGYRPFEDGAYAVVDDGDSLRVWYTFNFDYSAAPVATDRDPDFTLPKLTDRSVSCGVTTGTRTPLLIRSTASPFAIDEARAGLEEMVVASLAAAVGPVHTATGDPIDPNELAAVQSACGENDARLGIAIEFTTADNAASLAQILQTWDTAGYSSDRAIQEDIRYSDILPIERMSIRDSTTIDGLIHMQITTQCSEPR